MSASIHPSRNWIADKAVGAETHPLPVSKAWIANTAVCTAAAKTPEQLLARLLESDHKNNAPSELIDQDYLIEASGLTARDIRKLDRFSLLAVVAARQCLMGAGLTADQVRDCGIVTGNMTGGWTFTEPQLRSLYRSGLEEISPYLASAWFPAAPQGQISIHMKMHGYAKTIATDRCAGSQAVGFAFHRIQQGRSGLLLGGGAEAPVTPFVRAAYNHSFGQAKYLGEGAAYVCISDTAPTTPSEQCAVVVGAHETCALYNITGSFFREVVSLVERIVRACEIGHVGLVLVNTLVNPDIERIVRKAIEAVFPNTRPQTLFTNHVIGDCLAASGAVNVAAAHAFIAQGKYCSVLALSVGHHTIDAIWLRQWEG
jgi:hypothetical protein